MIYQRIQPFTYFQVNPLSFSETASMGNNSLTCISRRLSSTIYTKLDAITLGRLLELNSSFLTL